MVNHLTNITQLINRYKNLTINSGAELSDILRQLTCELFYLEQYRSEYQEAHNRIMHEFKGSVAASLILANEKIPELYMLRRVMNAAYRIVDAIRSNISYIKKEN